MRQQLSVVLAKCWALSCAGVRPFLSRGPWLAGRRKFAVSCLDQKKNRPRLARHSSP